MASAFFYFARRRTIHQAGVDMYASYFLKSFWIVWLKKSYEHGHSAAFGVIKMNKTLNNKIRMQKMYMP